MKKWICDACVESNPCTKESENKPKECPFGGDYTEWHEEAAIEAAESEE